MSCIQTIRGRFLNITSTTVTIAPKTFGNPSYNECYTLQNGDWQTFFSLNVNRFGGAISKAYFPLNGHSLMVTGGDTTASNTSTRSVQLNSSEILQEGGWKLSTSELPKSITNFCMVQINHSTVMTIGGFGPGYVQNTYIFNSELLSWSSGPLLNSKRERLACGNVI